MTRKSPATQKSTTHYEQISVDTVKKIVESDHEPKKAPARRDPATGQRSADAGHFHVVQFYNDPDTLCRIVGGFIGEGLEQGALAVVIGTPDHTARLDSCLQRRGIDVAALKRSGHLTTLDARATLQLFMTDGVPNPAAFHRTIGGVLTIVRRGREHCAVRAYGEMVDLLWKDGRESAAIRLETLWNQLGGTHDFDLLCGYSMGNFYKGAALDEIKDQHSHLVDDDGRHTVSPAGNVIST